VAEEKLQMAGVSKHFVRGFGLFAMYGKGSLSSMKVDSFGDRFLTTICRSWLVSRCGRQLLAQQPHYNAVCRRLKPSWLPFSPLLEGLGDASSSFYLQSQVPTGSHGALFNVTFTFIIFEAKTHTAVGGLWHRAVTPAVRNNLLAPSLGRSIHFLSVYLRDIQKRVTKFTTFNLTLPNLT
jgi:hypothetical protein